MDSIQKFNGMENGKVGKDVVKEIAIHVGKLKEKWINTDHLCKKNTLTKQH